MNTGNKDLHVSKTRRVRPNDDLQWRLEEAEQTLEAIRNGEVDAIVVAGPVGDQIYSLTGAEHAYRVIVETMNEAALTVDPDGTILFCNRRFCDLMRTPMHEVLGRKITDFAAAPQRPALEAVMAEARTAPAQVHLTLRAVDGTVVPVLLSASLLQTPDNASICLVASDLTELEESAHSIRVLREQQQALEESEARFRTIFESSQDAITIADDDGVYIQANPAVETIFGLPAERLIGRPISDFVDEALDFPSLWQEFLATGSFQGEIPLIGADGRTRFVEIYVVTSILPGRHLSVLRDVTEHKCAREALQNANEQLQVQAEELRIANEELRQNEQALRESEEQYHRLFEDDLTGDFISRPDGQIVLCNPAFAEIFGFSSTGEAARTNIQDLYLDVGERELLLERLKRQGKIERLGVWRKRHDGRPIYIVENLVGRFDEHGELREIKGYVFDDTERKQTEEALRQSEEKYRQLFNSIDEGFCIVEMIFDAEGRPVDYRFVDVNPAFAAQTGLRNAQGRSMRELAPNHEAHWFETYGRIAMTGEPARFMNEAKALHRWYDVFAFRVGDPESRRVAILFNDITEQRRTEESLRELTRTLEARVAQRTSELQHRARQLQKLALELSQAEERERKRLAVILHDDLQQQLAAAKFHVGIMAGRARGNSMVQSYAAQIDKMLRDAVETSRSLSHELSPAVMYHGDLGEILEWLANQIRAKHGLIVHVETGSEINTRSDALKTFLFRAVQEMLFNAVKHARVSEARVRLRRIGRYICLSVSDRGRGFDPQDLRQTAGFGLMSIRERIGLLGGRMRIHSVKGEGSRFIITVPDEELAVDAGLEIAARLIPGMETAGMAADGVQTQRTFRVLIADDHEIVRQGLASLLNEARDVEVVGEAANGREAVDMTYQLRPDVVIMDVAMPLMSGEEATKQIRKHLPETRVVALSMYDEVGTIDRMHRAGAETYVLKTAPSDELLSAVRGKPQ